MTMRPFPEGDAERVLYLKEMVRTIAKGEAKLVAKLMRALRERIAIALMTHQAYIIMWINQREQAVVAESVEA